MKMMDYETILNNKEFNNILDSINDKNKDYLLADHGRYHTMFVVNTIEKIMTELKFNNRMIELGKITGLLHDIGVIHGKKNHPERSSIMCTSFLDKTNLSKNEKDIIIDAIKDHALGLNINSPLGAVLIIADKIHFIKDRVLPLGMTKNNYLLKSIDNVNVNIENNKIIIELDTNEKFSIDQFLLEWKKRIEAIERACEYIGYDSIFKLDNKYLNANVLLGRKIKNG